MSDLTRNGRKDRAKRDLCDLMRTDSDIMRDIAQEFGESADAQEDSLTRAYYRHMADGAYMLALAHEIRPSLRNGR